jgi:hypothetical protein
VTTAPDLTDSVLTAAVDLARDAANVEAGGDWVGDHLEVAMEDERLATHLFACTNPAYRGWRWAVTITRAEGFDEVTITDTVLLPGPDSLIAPAWVPWAERVRPGDLGPGDVLPTEANDLRLVPGFTDEDSLEGLSSLAPLSPGMWELGLGRARVLSVLGRDEATERWEEGDFGADSPMAKAAGQPCGTCGFLIVLGGVLGQAFGVCANAFAPADGRVVALNYGCGAHSEVEGGEIEGMAIVVTDEEGWDHVDLSQVEDLPAEEPADVIALAANEIDADNVDGDVDRDEVDAVEVVAAAEAHDDAVVAEDPEESAGA